MDSRARVLLYLQRNESVTVSNSGQIVTKRSDVDTPVSRKSSVGSGRSSNNSRSSTPTPYSNSNRKNTQIPHNKFKKKPESEETSDKFSEKIKNIANELTECQILKSRVNKKYEKEEEKVLNYLNELILIEKRRIQAKTDINYNPFVRKEAENIVQKEKILETLTKENKAMKTLLAEMTLNEVDTRISISLDKQTKFENLSTNAYIKKFSRQADTRHLDIFANLTLQKPVHFNTHSQNYSEKVTSLSELWIAEQTQDPLALVKLICKKIVEEQETRLSSEESADTLIFTKEKKIKALEAAVKTLSK